jgi:hypothetical protein
MKSTWYKMAVALILAVGLLAGTGAMAAEKAKAGHQTIQGTVEKGDKGMTVVKTDDGQTFNVLGENMSAMVGKKIKVTGTLSKGKATRSIIVTSFEEIQE